MSLHIDLGTCPICGEQKVLNPSPYALIYTCWDCRGKASIARHLHAKGEAIQRAFGPKGDQP